LPRYEHYRAKIDFAGPVQYTDLLAIARRFSILFDDSCPGFDKSEWRGACWEVIDP